MHSLFPPVLGPLKQQLWAEQRGKMDGKNDSGNLDQMEARSEELVLGLHKLLSGVLLLPQAAISASLSPASSACLTIFPIPLKAWGSLDYASCWPTVPRGLFLTFVSCLLLSLSLPPCFSPSFNYYPPYSHAGHMPGPSARKRR